MRARLPVCSLFVPRRLLGRRPLPPAFTAPSPGHGRRAPETVAVHLVVPRPSSGWQQEELVAGRGGPIPEVRRVGFALDDPTSSRSGPESTARPRCWSCGARPCCGASANQSWLTCVSSASPSAWAVARTQRAHVAHHRTPRRLRHGPLAAGRRARRAPRWRRSAAASSPGCPSGPARSTTGCSARISTGSPSPTPTRPRPRPVPRHRPPRPAPAPPPRHHPRPRPPTMTLPPVPRRRPDLVPRGSPTVVPNPQIQRAHPCRCPQRAPAGRPRRVRNPTAPAPRTRRPVLEITSRREASAAAL